ncbi:PIN domain containing protein [uncultured Caudovirales phage]|uniref:PIN domain containing protein n=1 Tax=uncultured Caudovirales phage TaxID=2100421 RepID=A0A6J5M6C5_9CAUD|nr:PIN domain containing protein [uncultured Caudovirales phage]
MTSNAVIFDASFLLMLLDPDAGIPHDFATGKPIELAKERIDGLIEQLTKDRKVVAIPAPAFSEILMGAGNDIEKYAEALSGYRAIKILPFDQKAAIELALMHGNDLSRAKKRDATITHAKLKYDWQIIAIAKSENIKIIYTHDKELAKQAKNHEIETILLSEVVIPASKKQHNLKFE